MQHRCGHGWLDLGEILLSRPGLERNSAIPRSPIHTTMCPALEKWSTLRLVFLKPLRCSRFRSQRRLCARVEASSPQTSSLEVLSPVLPARFVTRGRLPGVFLPADLPPGGPLPGDILPAGLVTGSPLPGGLLPADLVTGDLRPRGLLPAPADFLPGGPLPGGLLPASLVTGGPLPGRLLSADLVTPCGGFLSRGLLLYV